MDIDNEATDDLVEVEEVAEDEEQEDDEVVERQQESLEDKEARLERQLSQTRKKMGKDAPKPKSKQSDDFDYGEYAYLAQKGVESDTEIEIVRKAMAESGKSLREVIASKWVQEDLEVAKTSNATPKSKGSTGVAIDSVDYWKGKDDAEIAKDGPKGMLLKVVDARMAEEGGKGHFYNS